MARAPKLEEERPPPDALEGVPLPRETTILIGHDQAERTLLDAYRSGRMPHGWIFAGERGIGRATLAMRLARFLFAHPDPHATDVAAAETLFVPPEHRAAHRVAGGVHANLLHLQRDWNDRDKRYRTALSVEAVRRITPFLGTTAGEGGWRSIVVDTADEMTISAANAILKNLEEPPRKTLFILIARSRGALLPTIVSRCRVLELQPLSPENMEAVARAVAPDDPVEAVTAKLAGGSARRLIELARNDGAALYRLMRDAIEKGDRQARLSLSARMADAAALDQFMDFYRGYLDRRVRGLAEPVAGSAPPAAPLVTWAELWEKAAVSAGEVEEYNLDRRQFVLDLLAETAAVLGRNAI